MSVKLLVQEFARIGDTPQSIERLRSFVLDLAVSGELLERTPSPSGLLSSELPWTIPSDWTVPQFSDLAGPDGVFVDGDWVESKDQDPNGDVRLTQLADVGLGRFRDRSSRFMRSDVAERLNCTYLEPGDILIARMPDPIGRACVFPGDSRPCVTVVDVAVLRSGRADVHGPYVVAALNSSRFSTLVQSKAAGTTRQRISRGNLGRLPFPLPSLAEQQRIVAKVDELMTLCDQLETAQKERELQRDALRSVSLHRLTATDDDAGTTADVRFFLDTSPRLITKSEHVAAVRQTILDLAVRGRLVPHSSEDGNGYDLVTKISRSRQGTGAKRPVSLVEGMKSLPSLPDAWTWAAIDEVSSNEPGAITDGPFGANLKTAHYVVTPGFRVIRLENIGHGPFRNALTTYITQEHWERLAKHHVFAGDLVVAGLVDPSVRACEVPGDIGPALVKADCYRFHVHPEFATHFALYYLNSPLCQDFAAVHHHGMTLTRLGLGNFRRLPIPVPPLAEQHRIVAKVDELMAVCDELDAALASAQFKRGLLLEALLHEALNENSGPTALAGSFAVGVESETGP